MDRRAVFFAVAAAVLGVLTPLAPSEFRGLILGLAAVYVLLALASFADWRSSRADRPRPSQAERERS